MPVSLTAPPSEQVVHRYCEAGWWPSTGLRDTIERVASADGSRVALIDNESTWTYSDLLERVERGVGALRRRGVGPAQPVVIVAGNSNESAAAFLSVIRCGGVAVMLDRRCGPRDLANALESSGARHAIGPGPLVATLGGGCHDLENLSFGELGSGERADDWAEPDPFAPRIVVFTSGTTRRAKGVIHSLNSISSGVEHLCRAFQLQEDDRPYLSTPLCSITGVLQLLASTRGAGLILEDRFQADEAVARIERFGATVIGGAPVILEMLFDAYERTGRSGTPLRRISLGGTMIPRSVLEVAIERYGIQPTRVYGSSEVPVHTASRDDDRLEDRLFDDGFPLAGSECRLGDAHEGGHELEVRGPNMFLGYLNDEDNSDAFRSGWFKTGDLVEISDGGRVRVLGRLKDVVARKGIKVSLTEVDDAALAISGAVEAACYGVPDDETGERVVLAVRAVEGADLSYEAVTAALLDAGLAKGKLPEEIVYWSEPLPRNASGKIVRSELASRGAPRQRDVAPRLSSGPAGRG